MNKKELYILVDKYYRDNFDTLVKRMTRSTGSKERAEDIVQEAFTRCLKYHDVCPDASQFEPWFHVILTNCFKDNKRQETMSGMSDEIETIEIPIDAAAIPSIVYKQIISRINSKEPKIAGILTLFLVKQLRPKEIGHLIEETENNIRQIVFRFRKELKEEFGL